MTERKAFKRHRFLKVLAIVTVTGAFLFCLGAIKPYVEARNLPFESCPVYFVNGSDFVRITDSSHGVYSVGEYGRESFSFTYDRGTYLCDNGETTWKMRLATSNDMLDLRTETWLWGTSI